MSSKCCACQIDFYFASLCWQRKFRLLCRYDFMQIMHIHKGTLFKLNYMKILKIYWINRWLLLAFNQLKPNTSTYRGQVERTYRGHDKDVPFGFQQTWLGHKQYQIENILYIPAALFTKNRKFILKFWSYNFFKFIFKSFSQNHS